MKRAIAPLTLVAILGLLLPYTACGFPSEGRSDVTDAGPLADGAGTFLTDGSVGLDVGPSAIGGEAPPDTSDDRGYAMACLDGVDADFSGETDCDDAECSAAPSCCVGSTSLACCTANASLYTLDFRTCTDPASCGEAAEVVGSPVLGSGALGAGMVAVVNPGATADSGVLVRAPIDLRSGHISLVAVVAAEGATGGMVDALAVGLFGGDAGGARSLPIAAMQISASRGEIGIVVGDVVIASAPLEASPEVRTFTLSVSPAGVVTLTGAGLSLEAMVEVPVTPLRVGVLGRSEIGAPTPVRIESVEVRRAACDVPDALVAGAFTLEDRTGLYDVSTTSSPSLATIGTVRYLAFDAELAGVGRRAIFVGVEDTTRPGTFVVETASGRPQPILTSSTFVDEVSEPALGWDTDHWFLYASGVANRRRSIVHSVAPPGGSFEFADAAVLVAPDDEFVSGAEPERDSPGLIPNTSSLIVAREYTLTGPAIVVLDVSGGSLAARAGSICGVADMCTEPALRTSQTLLSPRVGTFAIDADEVAAPAVGYHRGVYRLYYAGRRGLRWSIGVVISADALYWRRPDEGDVALAPAGTGAAALGVLGPDVTIGADGSLELFYTAWNGVDTSILRATQMIRQ